MNREQTGRVCLIWGALVCAIPAHAIELPSRFGSLDKNDDASITFAEFSDYTKTLGLTQTRAAQHFISMSGGDAVITQQEWFLAKHVSESQSWTEGYVLEPLEDAPTEVRPADIRAFESVPVEPRSAAFPIPSDPPTEEEAG